jgi:predicted membrane channel-forming protein YqfA (hemolysin III family)
MEPVYGILLAFLFFNENKELHPGFYIGMGLILLTVIIQVVRIIYQHKKEIIPN